MYCMKHFTKSFYITNKGVNISQQMDDKILSHTFYVYVYTAHAHQNRNSVEE